MVVQNSNTQPILASVDFSAESKAALLFASNLSNQEGRPLFVLHVMHDDGYSKVYRRIPDKEALLPLHEIAERVMDEFISEVRREHGGDDVLGSATTMVVDGLPVTRIPEVAEKINAGHIVVGGSQRGRASKFFNSSLLNSLAKNSRVSVSVIHADDHSDIN